MNKTNMLFSLTDSAYYYYYDHHMHRLNIQCIPSTLYSYFIASIFIYLPCPLHTYRLPPHNWKFTIVLKSSYGYNPNKSTAL